MHCCIGDGEEVKVCKDPWLPKTQSRKIVFPIGEYNELEASTLVDPIFESWNTLLVSHLFL